MIVTIAGIKRSGSTFLFNLARTGLEESGEGVSVSGARVPERTDTHHVIKVHPFSRTVADRSDRIITSDRDDIGILRSLGGFDPRYGPDDLSRMREDLEAWRKVADLHLPFDILMRSPGTAVESIRRTLGLSTEGVKVEDHLHRVRAIEPPKKKAYDPRSFLFRDHIQDHWI